jgi:hypothetical protein
MCPADTAAPEGYNGRVPAGCIAVAMAQVMYYYRYPLTGYGSHCIEPQPAYGPQCADFGAAAYEWNGMTDKTSKECSPIALLTWHAGIAVDMNYGGLGSVAAVSEIPLAFQHYFRFENTAEYEKRQFYDDSTWINILKADLDAGRPVIYTGDNGTNAHAWICDGYEADNMFHMNWGWSGKYNGFFNIDDMEVGGFSPDFNQAAVVGLMPETSQYPYFCSWTYVTGNIFGTIEDGSGPIEGYQSNADCNWLIDVADSSSRIKLSFTRFETNPGDVVTIYDGSGVETPLLGTFSGDQIPPVITSSGQMMLVRFNSEANSHAPGWMAKYEAEYHNPGISEIAIRDLELYPVPAKDHLYINFSNSESQKVKTELISPEGKILAISAGEFKEKYNGILDLADIKPGIYFIRITTGNAVLVSKIIIQK